MLIRSTYWASSQMDRGSSTMLRSVYKSKWLDWITSFISVIKSNGRRNKIMALTLSAWKYIHIWIIGVTKPPTFSVLSILCSVTEKLNKTSHTCSWTGCIVISRHHFWNRCTTRSVSPLPLDLGLIWEQLEHFARCSGTWSCRRHVHKEQFLLPVLESQPSSWFQCSYLLHRGSGGITIPWSIQETCSWGL